MLEITYYDKNKETETHLYKEENERGFLVKAYFKNGKTMTYKYEHDTPEENALQRLTRQMHQHPNIIKYEVEVL